jgi:TonB family protein
MRLVFGSALVFLAFAVFAGGQDRVISPQHLELPTGYPNVARAARLQGTVTVQLTISSDGKVTAADATSSDALLRASASAKGSGGTNASMEIHMFQLR